MSTAIYQSVTDQIVKALEQGVVPWRKPWRGVESLPANAVSKRPYRGVNLFLLGMSPYRDHRWLTFKQALDLGGHVRKGEESCPAIFWKSIEKEPEEPEGQRRSIPLLRLYRVFNVEQCSSLNISPLAEVAPLADHERIERAEAMVRAMPDPPQIEESGSRAWYKPAKDLVQVPPLNTFENADAYYATLFHELGHATGHERRLNRSGITEAIHFGSDIYSREELVAELTSAYCCGLLGLDNSLVDNSASYLGGWLKALKTDPKALVTAAGQAQRSADYLTGTVPVA